MQWSYLKEQKIWVALKLTKRGKKLEKLPVGIDGKTIPWKKDPESLITYEAAKEICASLENAVPGLVLDESLGLVAIDADIHPNYAANVNNVTSKWNTYSETSPSGGFHAFIECDIEAFIGVADKKVGLEAYNHKRLISVTENAINDTEILKVSQDDFKAWFKTTFSRDPEYLSEVKIKDSDYRDQLDGLIFNLEAHPDPDKLIELCQRNDRFRKAWEGVLGPTHSDEDAVLATWAYIANWPLQEIIDLMVAHNRKVQETTTLNYKVKLFSYYKTTLASVIAHDQQHMQTIEKFSISQLMLLPDVEWLVPDFVQKDGFSLIWGNTRAFKTFFTLDLCLRVSMGLPFFDKPTNQCEVLYVFGEGKAGLRKRLEAWFMHFGEEYNVNFKDSKMHLMPIQHDLGEAGQRDQFLRFVKRQSTAMPGIVVFDTLARCFTGFDENETKDMGKIIKVGDEIRSQGSSVIYVHHSGKDMSRGARGSIALEQSVDIAFNLSRIQKKGAMPKFRVHNDKSKDGEEIEDFYFGPEIIDLGRQDNLGGQISSCVIKKITKPQQDVSKISVPTKTGVIESVSSVNGSPTIASQTITSKHTVTDAERIRKLLKTNPKLSVREIRDKLGLNGLRYRNAREYLDNQSG